MRSILGFVLLVAAVSGLSTVAACGASSAEAPSPTADGGPPKVEAGPAADLGKLPCDVEKILVDRCSKCHSDPPEFAAPMPLMTRADLLRPALSDPSKKVYELVAARVASDAKKPMPPYPNAPLTAAQQGVLASWAAAGAPEGTVAECATKPPLVEPGVKCTPNLPIGPATPYAMDAASGDEYVCYGVELSKPTPTHVTAFVPRIDNTKIVHHIVLFEAPSAFTSTPTKCSPAGSLQWRMLMGWAPGNKGLELPKEAGFPLKTDGTGKTHYVVQMHYSNPQALAGQTDSSGLDLCTAAPREFEADVLAFGTQQIDMKAGMTTYEKNCSFTVPAQLGGIHLIAAMPHMHQLGTAMKTELFAGGPTGAASDLGTIANFSFNTQAWIEIKGTGDTGIVAKANDVIKTRCAWLNTTGADVGFGENTADEMCYSFTVYYPKVKSPVFTWAGPALGSQCQ